ncbi:hypothetical protein ACLM5H_23720 [Fredinandcohnia humi]
MDNLNKATPESELPKSSKPARRRLYNAGFYRFDQLANVTESAF